MVKLRTRTWSLMVSDYMARRSPPFGIRAPRGAPGDQWQAYCDWVYAYGDDCEPAAHDKRVCAAPQALVV